MNRLPKPFLRLLLTGWLAVAGAAARAADAGSVTLPATPRPETVATQDVLRAYLQLQEQLHTTQQAVERSRQDAEAAAARNAQAITERLNFLERVLGEQRAANRWLLLIAGAIAGFGFLAILLASYLQWRAVNRLAETAIMNQLLGLGRMPTALGPGEMRLLGAGNTAQTHAHLSSALERLEKRIHELRMTDQLLPPSAETLAGGNGETSSGPEIGAAPTAGNEPTEALPEAGRVTLLLGKGQSLLSLGQAEAALDCFDEVLSLEPRHVEALLKKGAAFEKLQKLNEAIACYDRAIEADSSSTLAYLYKGGVFNRLERHDEALECYEQALKTQERGQPAG
jgi:tetratricopeptide (TPR) repeat protein